MSDTSLVFNLVARERVSETLGKVREKFDAAAAGIATGVAGGLAVGVAQALDMSAASAKLTAQLGVGPDQAAELSKVAASVYSNAWGDSVETVNQAIRGVYQNIGDVSQAEGGLEGVTTKALALSETFDQEVGPTTAAVGQLIRTGLAKDANEAFDIITAGFQTSANKADDFLDTINEYSVQFKRVGLDGQTAIGLIDQAIDAGARDSDQVADAIGQFGEKAVAGGGAVETAFKTIGLNADTVKAKLQQGGKSGQEALQMTLDALRGTKDEQIKLNAATALFGDPGTVMGDALFAMDPAGAAAASGMDKAAGSTDKLVDKVGGTGASALESFKRKALTKLAEVSGGFVQFAMDNQAVFEPLAYTLAGLAGAILVVKGAMMAYNVITAISAGLTAANTAAIEGNSLAMLVYGARMAVVRTGTMLWTGAQWLLNAAFWSSPVTWIVVGIIALVAVIVLIATKTTWFQTIWSTVWGAITTAFNATVSWLSDAFAWFGTLPGKFAGWFGAAKDWAVRKMLDLVSWMAGLPGRALNAIIKLNTYLHNKAWQAFQALKDAAVNRALSLVSWMISWPGKIANAIGSLNNLLVSKGIAIVQGLWSGIVSMGSWIKNKLIGWAKNMIPGPIAKALGIASPSKVTKAQGRWIARGLIDGLTGSTKQVKAASTKLADIIRDSLGKGAKRSKALAKISTGTSQLTRLANQEVALAARLKKANKSLADLLKARDKLSADVKKGVLDAANITQISGGGEVSADSILTNLSDKLAQARSFAANLAKLRSKGVRGDLIAQIAQAGVEGGSAAAAALATADKGTIKQINSTQASLVTAAGQAGSVAGEAMYGAGIDAAEGIVRGLKARQKAIDKQMLRIAKGMKTAIQKALGINSPSTLMADHVGRWIPTGVVKGIEQTAPQLDQAMRGLVRTDLATPSTPLTTPTMAPLMGAQAGGIVRVLVDVTGAEGDFKKFVRKLVRVDGRGNVQIAFG